MPKTLHGHARNIPGPNGHTKTYRAWQSMLKRCRNPNDKTFYLYGGRGISVCERWLDFRNFLADMGEMGKGLTLERIDLNGNYEPSNCRLATTREQARNKRNNHFLTLNGETLCIVDWGAKLGLHPTTLLYRLRRNWSVEKTLTTPKHGAA